MWPADQVMAALVKRAAYAWYKGCEAALPALRLPFLLQLGAEACLMERMLSQLIRQPADKLFKAVRHHVANHVRSVSCLECRSISSIRIKPLLHLIILWKKHAELKLDHVIVGTRPIEGLR